MIDPLLAPADRSVAVARGEYGGSSILVRMRQRPTADATDLRCARLCGPGGGSLSSPPRNRHGSFFRYLAYHAR